MLWSRAKRALRKSIEAEQQRKIEVSQRVLLEAATSTADAAQHVTAMLKRHLEESIRQFNTTTSMLCDAFIISDSRGLVSAFNPAAEAMFGYPADGMLRRHVTSLFLLDGAPPNQRADLWTGIEHDLDGLGTATTPARLLGLRANGDTFPIETTLASLDRVEGDEVQMILVRDLTELATVTRDANNYEQRYSTLFDMTFDGILVVQGEQIVAANNSAGRLFGRSPDLLRTEHFTSLVDAQHRARLDVIDDGSRATVQASATLNDGTSVQLLFSGGEITWNNEPASLITVKDVSEMSRLETDVLGRRDNLLDMIVCFGGDFAITFANEAFCKMAQKSAAELLGSDVRDLLPEGERDTALLNLRSLSPEAPTRRVQIHIPHQDGPRLQDWIDHATFDSKGNPVEYQRCGRDITDVLNNLLNNGPLGAV